MEQGILEHCQAVLGYTFVNPDLLALSLTHSSVARTRVLSNERLEFLGDAVLGLVVCHQLYDSCEEAMEGEMTKIKSTVVSRQTCAAITQDSGIGELMSLGKGMVRNDGPPQSILAAAFESIIGAIYLDGGLEPARAFILHHVQPYIDEALSNGHQKNYKSMFQQYAQRTWSATPQYQLLDEKGPDHSRCFEVGVTAKGRFFASAWGKNKKEAIRSSLWAC